MAKIPVGVIALFGDDIHFQSYKIPSSSLQLAKYRVIPLKILTQESQTLIVDKITDISRQASLKAGGLGVRYTCYVTDETEDVQKQIYIYKDENDWYLEEYF